MFNLARFLWDQGLHLLASNRYLFLFIAHVYLYDPSLVDDEESKKSRLGACFVQHLFKVFLQSIVQHICFIIADLLGVILIWLELKRGRSMATIPKLPY